MDPTRLDMQDVGREDSGSAPDFSYRLLRNDHCLVAKSCLTLATPWTVAHQAPLSVGFPRQEYWSGLPFSSPADLPDPGIRLSPLTSLALAGRFFPTSATWEAPMVGGVKKKLR